MQPKNFDWTDHPISPNDVPNPRKRKNPLPQTMPILTMHPCVEMLFFISKNKEFGGKDRRVQNSGCGFWKGGGLEFLEDARFDGANPLASGFPTAFLEHFKNIDAGQFHLLSITNDIPRISSHPATLTNEKIPNPAWNFARPVP